jgi:hypothetical protein
MTSPMESHPLQHELELYEHKKQQWLRSNPNQFVVISGETIAGFFADYETAFRAGVQRFGVQADFLIKQICRAEPVYVVY